MTTKDSEQAGLAEATEKPAHADDATASVATNAPADTVQEKMDGTGGAPSVDTEKPAVKEEQPVPQSNATQDAKPEAKKDGDENKGNDGKDDKKSGPEGGYSDTPIPKPPSGTVGYTLKFTMHKATDLLMGDAQTFSSDPYISLQLNTNLETRHKEDPPMRFRTFTIRRKTNAEWNESWTVANVPSSGFKLKLRVYDEDPADHDDLLGKAAVSVDSIDDKWPGIKNQAYKLSIAQGSKRAIVLRSVAACFGLTSRHLQGQVILSVENLGKTGNDGQNGRLYTVAQCRWFRHHSPLLGRLTHTKDNISPNPLKKTDDDKNEKQVQHYNFQANEMQLQGPVPPELYHRFVEFRPWVKRMFTTTGIQGVILGKALHHQHARVYNFDRSTVWGHFPDGPCTDMTKKFLELVHYDQGGRIFTYVLTLDALWRFTETGKEFGIDMLSKHTMHSDVSIYIAFSGEFFIRRLKKRREPPPPHPSEDTSQSHAPPHEPNESHPPDQIDGGPPEEDPPTDPSYYELYIDNDSGTYRPNAKMLPILAKFLAKSLPGLHIQTLDCQADEKKMNHLKQQQRDRKKAESQGVVYTQDDRDSVSSSDEEDLDRQEQNFNAAAAREHENFATGTGAGREHGTTKAFAKDVKLRNAARWDKAKREYGRARDEDEQGQEGEQGPSNDS